MGSLVGAGPADDVETAVVRHLGLDTMADIIHRLKWLGLFDDRPVAVKKGACLDVLLDRMLARMSYEPHERDMILLHIDALAEFPDGRRERRLATMHVEGIPDGPTAMSRAVALPAPIAARLVLEGEIQATGVRMPPTLPELFKPVLEELATFGYEFKCRTVPA